MGCAVEKFIEICQGKTFNDSIVWGVAPLNYKAITGISQSAPAVVTCPDHGLIQNWPFTISHVVGMREVNDLSEPPEKYHFADVLTDNTLALQNVVSLLYSPYVSGGVIRYPSYPDFTGFSAVMDFRNKAGGTLLHRLTSEVDGGIILDNVSKKIRIHMSATTTAAFMWKKGVHELELTAPDGTVYSVIAGGVAVYKEVVV